MDRRLAVAALIMAGVTTPLIAQSEMSSNTPPPPKPNIAAVRPAAAAPDMQAVLDAHTVLMPLPIEMLTPVKARIQPSPADAAKAVMRRRGMSTAPDPAVSTLDIPYGPDPMQFARVYRPADGRGRGMPLVIYYHGGGFVIADVNTYDATPREMAKQLGAVVVSVEYRKAPEAKFPAQHEDAAAAFRWALANARSWGANPERLVLAGESAGGNLAVATAIYARDNRMTMPRAILAVYPIANSSMTLPSRRDSAMAKPLNTPMLGWFGYYYSRTKADQRDPRIDLVRADLRGLPPVTIVNAQIDPLRSDGETLARALRNAGNDVDQRTFPGVTHEFFGMAKVVRGAADAQTYGFARVTAALGR